MEDGTRKSLEYIGKRLIAILSIVLVCILAYNIAFNQSRVRTFIADAMEDRAAALITHEDTDSLLKYFDASYVEQHQDDLNNDYSYYNISGYDYVLDINRVSVGWISPGRATVTVSEHITDIRGQYNGSEEDNVGLPENPPEWQSARYKIKMRKYDGRWYITSIEKTKDLN